MPMKATHMTAKTIVDKIKILLQKVTAKFEAAKLSDGTMVEYSALEAGGEFTILNAEGQQAPAPAGEYELEDGRIVVITEEGKIAEVKEAAAPPAEEQEMEDQPPAPDASADLEALRTENASLKDRIASLESGQTQLRAALTDLGTIMQEFAAQEPEQEPKIVKQTVFSDKAKSKGEAKSKIQSSFKAFAERLKQK